MAKSASKNSKVKDTKAAADAKNWTKVIRTSRSPKTGAYTFVDGTQEQLDITVNAIKETCIVAYENYQKILASGVAREVARAVLPVTENPMIASTFML